MIFETSSSSPLASLFGFLWLGACPPARGDSTIWMPAGRLRLLTTVDSSYVSLLILSHHYLLFLMSLATLL